MGWTPEWSAEVIGDGASPATAVSGVSAWARVIWGRPRNNTCVALTGGDWDSIVQRRAREEKTLTELGLTTVYAPLTPANVKQPVPGNGAPDAQPADGSDVETDDAPADDDASDLEGA